MSLTRTVWSGNNTVLKFSTEEVDSHQTWIDGRRIWRKIVNLGALPDATIKSVAHSIPSYSFFTTIVGFANNGTTHLSLPYASSNWSASIAVYVEGQYVKIDPGASDRSDFTIAYAILEYVKP